MKVDVAVQRAIGLEDPATSSAGTIAFVVAIHVNSTAGWSSMMVSRQSNPVFDGNESETAGVVGAEFDKRGCYQIEGLAIPEIHLLDPPFAPEARAAPATCPSDGCVFVANWRVWWQLDGCESVSMRH